MFEVSDGFNRIFLLRHLLLLTAGPVPSLTLGPTRICHVSRSFEKLRNDIEKPRVEEAESPMVRETESPSNRDENKKATKRKQELVSVSD